ncbi:phytanoyl-CoA dioxygenase family protein [Fulvivirga sedimenti]|uniref:Phytanoyl-CoA dioxygenase family protein n=1 Tax=Fulvivirga sedimenti TaxID=2879465 RepID=A0A9X1HT00_9BACT|nr:phytanoyl-CoA dioxygenase family protein [Fulvivirga sedimenti]MCA6075086.1 phytanoyl-CoA dioxygenase family protein [Fulvivirga sedimenti]MCA6076263.1 phytanoyl-CoA dioxygenase family protein [Fulvivirga sedimenti]MCA6077391.1 phytanoyl-CoA dioxygenase family protein [Fulvivirga sedimenti]
MKRIANDDSGAHRRKGLQYKLTNKEIEQYHEQGYLVLNDVLTEEEVAFLEPWFDHFVEGKEMDRMGRDFCDMSQPYGTPMEDFQLVNAMLPSTYRKELENNIFHQITQNIADQLYSGGKAAIDYEQFLAKKPSKEGAEFAMHQDLGYWPKTKNTWTATFSLALTDSDLENGCLQVLPGTNKEPELRKHVPKKYSDGDGNAGINREDSHTLVIETNPDDEVVYLPVKRGSVTIHDERIVHGSGGNSSPHWRKTYVVAYRDTKTIDEERAMGFTHSHNDKVNWDEIIK